MLKTLVGMTDKTIRYGILVSGLGGFLSGADRPKFMGAARRLYALLQWQRGAVGRTEAEGAQR